MKTASIALALATLASQVAAGPFRHSQFHKKNAVVKRDALSTNGASMISSLGIMPGKNSCATDGTGTNTLTFTNNAADELVIVVWDSTVGYQASFVKSCQAIITESIQPGETVTYNLDGYTSGAFAPIYSDTTMSEWGQIMNTWGEFTFGQWGTFDVSREVYATGRNVSMVSDTCTSDMDNCVFKCNDASAESCGVAGSYALNNCPNYPVGAISGGCAIGASNTIATTIC